MFAILPSASPRSILFPRPPHHKTPQTTLVLAQSVVAVHLVPKLPTHRIGRSIGLSPPSSTSVPLPSSFRSYPFRPSGPTERFRRRRFPHQREFVRRRRSRFVLEDRNGRPKGERRAGREGRERRRNSQGTEERPRLPEFLQ